MVYAALVFLPPGTVGFYGNNVQISASNISIYAVNLGIGSRYSYYPHQRRKLCLIRCWPDLYEMVRIYRTWYKEILWKFWECLGSLPWHWFFRRSGVHWWLLAKIRENLWTDCHDMFMVIRRRYKELKRTCEECSGSTSWHMICFPFLCSLGLNVSFSGK